MKKAMQNTGATALLISFAGLGGVLDQGASPVNLLMLAFIGIICCLAADRLQETKKRRKTGGKAIAHNCTGRTDKPDAWYGKRGIHACLKGSANRFSLGRVDQPGNTEQTKAPWDQPDHRRRDKPMYINPSVAGETTGSKNKKSPATGQSKQDNSLTTL